MVTTLKRHLRGPDFWFGQVNSRPLSLFRIGFALVLLKEALFHLPLAEVFYSDIGVVPRSTVWEIIGHRFSLMDILPYSWMAILFFLGWACVAVCLLIGFRTRLMSVLNFVIVLSVYERNPFVVNGADDILRLLSFWIIFIPLDHFYSVDAVLARNDPDGAQQTCNSTYAFPVRLIQVQIALIYLGAGIFKLLGEQWRNGTALSYVLQLDSWLLPTGKWLGANSPDWLLHLMTYQVIIIEIAFPILVFAPLRQPVLRLLGLSLVALMHLGIALTTPLLDFLLVLSVSYILFFSQSIHAKQSDFVVSFDAETSQDRRKRTYKLAISILLAVLMAFVLWENADNFRWHDAPIAPVLPSTITSLLNLIGLHQGWDLFSPNPVQLDWSIAVPGTFGDQTSLELRTRMPFREEIIPIRLGPEYRWKQLEFIVSQTRAIPLLESWGDYYCRQYNTEKTPPARSPLLSVQLQFVYRYSHRPGQAINPVQNDVLWVSVCKSTA